MTIGKFLLLYFLVMVTFHCLVELLIKKPENKKNARYIMAATMIGLFMATVIIKYNIFDRDISEIWP